MVVRFLAPHLLHDLPAHLGVAVGVLLIPDRQGHLGIALNDVVLLAMGLGVDHEALAVGADPDGVGLQPPSETHNSPKGDYDIVGC